MALKTQGFYAFGDFRFDVRKRVLWSGQGMVPLTPKAAEVLVLLLDDPGNLIDRQELIEKVWSGTFVEEGNLNHAISVLRKILGADAIQTVPRRGYRLALPVSEPDADVEPDLVIEKTTQSTTVVEELTSVADTSSRPATLVHSLVRPRYAIAAAALVATALLVWFVIVERGRGRENAAATINSVAVLPLKSFSSGDRDEELRFRITDALITRLGELNELVVRPTNSVLAFKNEQQDAVEAGKKLGVDAVIDGRVQEEGGRLRVTLQLISIPAGEQLWSEQFDGRVGEILLLQDSISNSFQRALALGGTRQPNRRPSTVNNEAYEAYLMGRYLWNLRREETYYAALEYFEKSVQLDPDFALGYTGIADTYHLLQQRNTISTVDAFVKAEAAARRALELDPDLAEAHVSMGAVSAIRYSRWREAESYYLRAIELNPNLGEAYGRLGMLYNCWGRFDEAERVLVKAESLDPTSLNLAIYRGANYYFTKQWDRAESQFKRILEFAPRTERAHFFLWRIYELTGRFDEAVAYHLKEREGYRPGSVESLRSAYETGGIRAFWLKEIEFLEKESKEMHGLEHHLASRHLLLGETERACDDVERSLENLGAMWNYGRVDPMFDGLRSNSRYTAAMKITDPPAAAF